MSILHYDDSRIEIELLKIQLKELGIRTVGFASATDAVGAVNAIAEYDSMSEKICAAVVDWFVPPNEVALRNLLVEKCISADIPVTIYTAMPGDVPDCWRDISMRKPRDCNLSDEFREWALENCKNNCNQPE
jgi:hypothetical protein